MNGRFVERGWLNIINCCSSSPCIREKKIIARNISSVQPKAFERAIRCDVVPVLVAKVSSERGTNTKVKPPHSFAGEKKNCGMCFQNTFAVPTNYFQHTLKQCVVRACCTPEPRAAANIMSTAPSLEKKRKGRIDSYWICSLPQAHPICWYACIHTNTMNSAENRVMTVVTP